MSIIFATPTIAAPATIITLPDIEQLPRSGPVRLYQKQFDTDAGAMVVFDFGGQVNIWTMQLYPLTAAQAAAIKSFFLNAIGAGGVSGRAGAWQMQDSDSVLHNVHFAMDVIEPQQRTAATWQLAITVRAV